MTNEQKQKLENLSNNKLIDVVKNYRQYSYDEHIRTYAIKILENRGITKEELKLTGNFENRTYDFALDLYDSFSISSRNALIMYLAVFVLSVSFTNINTKSQWLMITFIVLITLSAILFTLFLIMSLVSQRRFFNAIGKKSDYDAIWAASIYGSSAYIITYFYIRNKMKKLMNEIK